VANATGARVVSVARRGPDRAPASHRGLPGPADPADSTGMVRVRVEGSPLTAAAALTWHGDLCRSLRQVLFDAADSITP